MLLLIFKIRILLIFKLLAINNITEKNKTQAKIESIISFNEDQIGFVQRPYLIQHLI